MAKVDYAALAPRLLNNVGGEENIASMTHCATRMRFVLKDTSPRPPPRLIKHSTASSLRYRPAASTRWSSATTCRCSTKNWSGSPT